MDTYGRHMALTLWMLALLTVVVFVVAVRGPIRNAAWEQPCRDLSAGKAIPGAWNTIKPCRQVGETLNRRSS